MNSNKCAVRHGVKNSTIFVLIWLEIKEMVPIVFSMKAETHFLNAFRKVKLFIFEMYYPIKNRDALDNMNQSVSLENQKKGYAYKTNR